MYDFRVEPGVISYPGELVVEYIGRRQLLIFTRNRSAMVLSDVRCHFPKLYQRYGIAYTGLGRDDFYDFYHSLEPMPQNVPEWRKKLEAL